MRALIVVDVQQDFLPGGALAVPNGNEIIPTVKAWVEDSEHDFATVVFTQDWHPAGHSSFVKQGGPWPAHCVKGTVGARFAHGLGSFSSGRHAIIQKGTRVHVDSYSAFVENDGVPTGLNLRLKQWGIDEVWILGLATDYCVKATALDAVRLGYRTYVIREGCRAVGDPTEAFAEMMAAGVVLA